MSVLELRKFFLATLMAFAVAIMLPACSSTEEAPDPAETDESGSTEDCPPSQPGCLI
mgnify:CR=1 FL=1